MQYCVVFLVGIIHIIQCYFVSVQCCVVGRQVGYSLGCTVEDCKNILMDYKAYQGMNMDGGSSAIMWYNGQYITKSSSVTGIGRYMPDALIVKRASQLEEKETIIKAEPNSK